MSDRFPDDHFVEILRGMKKPPARQVRRFMVARCRWLQEKCHQNMLKGLPTDMMLGELSSVVVLMEMFEAQERARTVAP
jgi:hypothetical protein